MNRNEFELKLKEAGFENLDAFIDETKLKKRKIELFLKNDDFPAYFDVLFECLIKIKGVDMEELTRNEDISLKIEFENLVLRNEKLNNELSVLKKIIKE